MAETIKCITCSKPLTNLKLQGFWYFDKPMCAMCFHKDIESMDEVNFTYNKNLELVLTSITFKGNFKGDME